MGKVGRPRKIYQPGEMPVIMSVTVTQKDAETIRKVSNASREFRHFIRLRYGDRYQRLKSLEEMVKTRSNGNREKMLKEIRRMASRLEETLNDLRTMEERLREEEAETGGTVLGESWETQKGI